MNKQILIGAGAIVLIGGITAFVISSKNTSNTSQNSQPEPTITTETQPSNSQKSLKELLALGSPQQCSYKDETGNTGTVYIANNKMRADFTAESAQAHIIVDGQTTYMWMDGQKDGYKMSLNPQEETPTNNQQSQINMDEKVEVDCKTWTVNSDSFNLPKDVKFTDFSAVIPTTTNKTTISPSKSNTKSDTSTNSNAAQCAACDSLEGEAKDQCKVALKCN